MTACPPHDRWGDQNDLQPRQLRQLISEAINRLFEWDHADRLTTFRDQTVAAQPSVYAQYRL